MSVDSQADAFLSSIGNPTEVRDLWRKVLATLEDLVTAPAGVSTFLGLSDTPASYAGSSLKVARVNVGETGLEFVTLAGGGDMLKTDNLSGLANYTTARSNLGLGSLATQSGTFSGSSSGTNTGDQTISLTGDVTGSGTGSFAATVANSAITLAKMANMATASLLYRKTAGAGAPEVQTLATLKTDLGLTGTNSGDQTISLTGDVTGSGVGSFAATIANSAVTLAKMADMNTSRLLGRVSAAVGVPEEIRALGGIEFDGSAGIQVSAFTGDVTKAAGGTALTIANSAVSLAKMADMATASVIYRKTAASGPPEVQTLATLKTDLGLTGTNSGDQTSVSGNAGTATTLQTARNINGVSFNGSADIVAALYGRVTGSNFTRTAQTLADVTGLSVALQANSVYDFQACLSVASSSTAGNGYGINYSAAGATIEAQISGTSTATASVSKRISALNTSSQVFVAVAADGAIWIEGIITTGANAGNLTIQNLKVTSGTSTVYINSYLRAIKIA